MCLAPGSTFLVVRLTLILVPGILFEVPNLRRELLPDSALSPAGAYFPCVCGERLVSLWYVPLMFSIISAIICFCQDLRVWRTLGCIHRTVGMRV